MIHTVLSAIVFAAAVVFCVSTRKQVIRSFQRLVLLSSEKPLRVAPMALFCLAVCVGTGTPGLGIAGGLTPTLAALSVVLLVPFLVLGPLPARLRKQGRPWGQVHPACAVVGAALVTAIVWLAGLPVGFAGFLLTALAMLCLAWSRDVAGPVLAAIILVLATIIEKSVSTMDPAVSVTLTVVGLIGAWAIRHIRIQIQRPDRTNRDSR